ncbi:MAG: FAD binding domain-containing protein [Myxococcales bacterium]|nr:FAD binding domain-containing protein [Myxococcales bacterium]
MLTLPPFEYHAPTSVEEAVALLGAHPGAKLIAGGTDILPNMKHRLLSPAHLVGLKAVRGLSDMKEEDGCLRLGAMLTIAELAKSPRVRTLFPSLSRAAEQIAGPQLREMGTLGGNLCLDTRCIYFNQTHFWRKALGFCLKKDGTVCHVVKGGTRCVAAASNDTAPVLMTLGATVRLAGPAGGRELPIGELYVADGVANTVLRPDELVVELRLPVPEGRVLAGFQKLRVRASIDFPLLSVALAAKVEADGRVDWLRLAVTALGARPHSLGGLERFAGRRLDEPLIAELGRLAQKQCHPLGNIDVEPQWRRQMLPVLVRRALAEALTVPA